MSKIDKSILEVQDEKTHSLTFSFVFDEVLYEVFEKLIVGGF